MKISYFPLLFILAALLIMTGCGKKLPIKYSPLKHAYQNSTVKNEPEREGKLPDELLKEDERLYKELKKQTIEVENAEDEDDEDKDKSTEANNETRIEGHNDIVWFEIGLQAITAEKWNEALNAFNKVIILNPKNEEAYFNRGNVYDELGNYKQAVIDYNKAIKLNPIYADAYLNRGFAYNNLGKLNKAVADIKKAAKLGNNFAQMFLKKKGMSW
jgi:tetratricopeptide (TPR) repeat protein